MKYLQKKDFGRVPSYLLERKIEMAEKHEADLRAKEASRIPPGEWLLRVGPRCQERLADASVLLGG